jgi:pimeloyl-ACP methyl ester carboxylesterase
MIRFGAVLCLLAAATAGFWNLSAVADDAPRLRLARDTVATAETTNGTFAYFIPTTARDILVLAHGYPWRDGSRSMNDLRDHARAYVERWRPFAERQGLILIAPAFGSGDFAGYRALFGRRVDADKFVIELVDTVAHRFLEGDDERFFLYGHSAGAQFATRFLVAHPGRLKTVVISAPATYPFPDPAVRWPYGMGPVVRTAATSGDAESGKDPLKASGTRYEPNRQAWTEALRSVSIRVLVGSDDLRLQSPHPGQRGATRVSRARYWVDAMQALANDRKVDADLRLQMVEGVNHDPVALTRPAQDLLIAE